MQCSVSAVPGRCPMVQLRCPKVPGRCLVTPIYRQRVLHCNRVPSQVGPGVLTKSNTEKGGQLIDLVPMSTRRQPSNPCLWLGLFGCQLVDIGMKLHSVHFAVKFFSAPAAPRLRRTGLQSAPRASSSQVGLSPTKSQRWKNVPVCQQC